MNRTNNVSRTTVTLHEDTVQRLKHLGRFGESFNSLVNRILNEAISDSMILEELQVKEQSQ